MTNKKQGDDTSVNANNTSDNAKVGNDSITVEMPELEHIFNWDKEEECFKDMYYGDDEDTRIPYRREKTVEQTRYENWLAKCKDPHSKKFYTSGEGTGICKGKTKPQRIVTSIMRFKAANNGAEYLLSTSKIIGYNQFGDPVFTTANWPEKYNKTLFRWEMLPNHTTGYASRVNTGPCGSEVVYTLPFTKENAQKLFDMRDGNNIQFLVKIEDRGIVYEVKPKPQIALHDTFKLFVESEFDYLYNANYISNEQKMLNLKTAEREGLIPKQSDDDARTASILAQQALSQRDKMVSYG